MDRLNAKDRLKKAHKPFITKEQIEDLKMYAIGAGMFFIAWVFIIAVMSVTK